MDLFEKKIKSGSSANIKGWVGSTFGTGEEDTILVTELVCTEPGCPPFETVIVIFSKGESRQFKLHQPMSEITQDHIFKLREVNKI